MAVEWDDGREGLKGVRGAVPVSEETGWKNLLHSDRASLEVQLACWAQNLVLTNDSTGRTWCF